MKRKKDNDVCELMLMIPMRSERMFPRTGDYKDDERYNGPPIFDLSGVKRIDHLQDIPRGPLDTACDQYSNEVWERKNGGRSMPASRTAGQTLSLCCIGSNDVKPKLLKTG